jgi:hypothetical protein
MTDVESLRERAGRVPADAPPEAYAEILSALDGMKARIRDAEKFIKAHIQEVMEERGIGRIDLGDGVYWYLGTESSWKPQDVPATLEALLESNGGDVRGLAEFIASDGLKPGACRAALPDDKRDVLFVRVYRTVLKEGKPVRQLLKGDERFVKG